MDIQIYENFDEILDKISEYRLVNKQEELEVLSNRLLEHEHDDEYSYMTALGYYALAEVRYLQKNFLECMSLHWKVHFICEHNEFPRLHALSSNLAGKASGSQGDYHNSVTLFLQGYYIAREHKYTDVEAWILNNIGTLFFTLEHYEEAILYFERAMNLIENGFQFVQEFHEILIMNIISAYLHMKNFHEVEIWTKKFYDLFPHTKNALISSGMQMKKVLHAYDIKALHLFKKEVKHLVQITQEHWTGNYAVQILLETGELCYELECYEEMELSLHHLRDHIQVIDYRHRIQLSNLLIKLYQVTKQKIALFDELNMYYDLTKKFEDLQRSIELKGLKSKIVLEKEITAKKKIIEKNEELTALSERDPYTGFLMDCVQLLKEHVSKDDYKTWMSVSSICIQMYQQQKKKELYYHELEMYYQYYHMAAAYDRQMEYMNLKNIILLEEERAVSNQLLRQHVELSKKSECDSFTGLLNKTACISKINTYIQEKGIEEVAVFFIVDVDNFKNINDTYGHLFGDVVLKEIANILRKYIRTSDIIGRIGGDEFCFLLKNVKNMDRIYLKLDKIMEDIQKIKLKEMKQGITISMGGIQLVKHLIYEDILRKADQALYEAKRKGKNTYVLLENY